jgi:hypothetical protein
MAISYPKLADIQTVASSAGSIFSNPSSKSTYIRSIVLHNTNSTAETVKLYNVPDSAGSVGTAAATNRFLNISLAANASYEWKLGPIPLTDENDSIQAETTTASKVTVMIFGVQDP